MSGWYEKLKNWVIEDVYESYSTRDTILYALGVGAASSNTLPDSDLKYVYEKDLVALPTMHAVLGVGPFWMAQPETQIDVSKILHGEQFLRIHRPLPAEGKIVSRTTVDEIFDKGADKGAVMYVSKKIYSGAAEELLATVGLSVFMRGNGGMGGVTSGAPRPHQVPEGREPDDFIDLITRPEQSVIYRLSGDWNPLHIDPEVAKKAGFDRPILHGLCSYGVAGRAVLKLLCGNDAERLRQFDVRFASPVYPGETLRVEVWRESEGVASFRVRVRERDVICLSNGYVEYVA